MRWYGRNLILLLATVVGLAGCGGGAATEEELAADSVATAGAAAVEPLAPRLGDAEIVHVAVTASTIEAELGRLATSKSTNPDVARFAETVIADHTAVNEQAVELAASLGLTPADNATSRQLQEGAAEARARLESLSGEAFDGAYVNREVEYHQAVLDAFDGALIPGAQNAQLKELLRNVRPAMAAHLQRALQIQASLGSPGAARDTSGG
jgi:putative membrane protein